MAMLAAQQRRVADTSLQFKLKNSSMFILLHLLQPGKTTTTTSSHLPTVINRVSEEKGMQ